MGLDPLIPEAPQRQKLFYWRVAGVIVATGPLSAAFYALVLSFSGHLGNGLADSLGVLAIAVLGGLAVGVVMVVPGLILWVTGYSMLIRAGWKTRRTATVVSAAISVGLSVVFLIWATATGGLGKPYEVAALFVSAPAPAAIAALLTWRAFAGVAG